MSQIDERSPPLYGDDAESLSIEALDLSEDFSDTERQIRQSILGSHYKSSMEKHPEEPAIDDTMNKTTSQEKRLELMETILLGMQQHQHQEAAKEHHEAPKQQHQEEDIKKQTARSKKKRKRKAAVKKTSKNTKETTMDAILNRLNQLEDNEQKMRSEIAMLRSENTALQQQYTTNIEQLSADYETKLDKYTQLITSVLSSSSDAAAPISKLPPPEDDIRHLTKLIQSRTKDMNYVIEVLSESEKQRDVMANQMDSLSKTLQLHMKDARSSSSSMQHKLSCEEDAIVNLARSLRSLKHALTSEIEENMTFRNSLKVALDTLTSKLKKTAAKSDIGVKKLSLMNERMSFIEQMHREQFAEDHELHSIYRDQITKYEHRFKSLESSISRIAHHHPSPATPSTFSSPPPHLHSSTSITPPSPPRHERSSTPSQDILDRAVSKYASALSSAFPSVFHWKRLSKTTTSSKTLLAAADFRLLDRNVSIVRLASDKKFYVRTTANAFIPLASFFQDLKVSLTQRFGRPSKNKRSLTNIKVNLMQS